MPAKRTTPFIEKDKRTERETILFRVPLAPRIPVVYASPYERAIGRLMRATVGRSPNSTAEEDLLGDIFYMMYKSNPEIKDKKIVPIEREINRLITTWASKMSNFDSARAATIGSIPAAMASAMLMWEALLTDEALKDALALQKKSEELQDMADKYAREASNAAHEYPVSAQQLLDRSNNLSKDAKEFAQAAANKIQKIADNPLGQGLMSGIVKQAGKRGKDVADMIKGWGQEKGNMSLTDIDEIVRVTNQNKGKLADIANLVGRFKGISSKTMERVRSSYVGPVAEPNLTRDLMQIFPTERAKLSPKAPPVLRNLQVVRWADTGLLGWRRKAEGKRAGVFRAEVDGSGSMSGTREIIAKSIALGIAFAVKADREASRFYQLATFGAHDDPITVIDSNDSLIKHFQWASLAPFGGTDFNKAMKDGLDGLESMSDAGHTGGDLLFITDGEARLSDTQRDRFIQFSRDTGARLIYVQIGGHENAELREICSLYIQVDQHNLSNVADDLVIQITEQIVRPVG